MTDQGAVRVRLAAVSADDGDQPMVVGPGEASDGSVLAQRHASVDGVQVRAGIVSLDGARHRLADDGHSSTVILEPTHSGPRGVRVREVLVDGFRFLVEVEPERLAALRDRARRANVAVGRAGPLEVRAVIPGRLVALWVGTGDTVTAGERVLAIEAMKMQNELLAPRDGTIVRIGVGVGATVEIGDLLVVIE